MRSEKIVIRMRPSLFLTMAIGLAALLAIRDIGGVGLPKFIYLGYIVFFMAIANYETLVNMLCFIFPLVCGLPGTYIMLCALALLFIKRKRINVWQLGLLLFVATMEFLAALWYPTISFPNIIQYISFAGVMFFLIHDDTELDFLRCVRSYFWGVCLLCAIILTTGIMTAPSDWLTLFARGAFRFGSTQAEVLEGMQLSLNANSLAYYSVTGIVCGVLLVERETGTRSIWNIVLACFCASVGFLTLSRSWLVVVILCLLFYLVSKVKSLKRLGVALLVMALILFWGFMYLKNHPELLAGIVTRFLSDDVQSGNGRAEIFTTYMKTFFSSPRYVMMGTGVTQISSVTHIKESLHNGTQQILICYGVFGFFVFLTGIFKAVLVAAGKEKGRTQLIRWLPLIGTVLFVQTIQFLNPMMLMLPFVISVYALKAIEKR